MLLSICLAASARAQSEVGSRESAGLQRQSLDSVKSPIDALESLLSAPVRDRLIAREGLIVWPQSIWVGTVHETDERTFRYLILHLAFANTSDLPVTIRREQIVVESAGRTFVAGELPRAARIPLHADQTEKRPSELRIPNQFTVEPGQSVWCWCAFAPLPSTPAIPGLNLRVGEPGEWTLDLNRLARDRLALETSRIGPRNALALIKIRGHLDALSTQTLADELELRMGEGIERAAIYWEENSSPIDSVLLDWLLVSQSSEEAANLNYKAFAKLPQLRQLHVAQSPVSSDELSYEAEELLNAGDHVQTHERPEQAVAAALRNALPEIPAREIFEQLRSGHPWVQRAILFNSQVEITPEAWEIVKLRLESPDLEDQLGVISVLSRMREPRAVEALARMIQPASSVEIRTAALNGLVQSTVAEAEHRIERLLVQGMIGPEPWAIQAVSQAPHSRFAPWMIDCLESDNAATRVAALNGLDRLGIDSLAVLAEHALADRDLAVRRAAFEILSGLAADDKQAARAATEFALLSFPDLEFDDTVRQVIETTRDTRFAPLLLQLLDQPDENLDRHSLIILLGQIGDEKTSRELIKRFPQLSAEARFAVMRAIEDWDDAGTLELAALALNSEDSEVLATAARVLQDSGDPRALQKLIQRFETGSSDTREVLSALMSETNSPETGQAILRWRDQAHARSDVRELLSALGALESRRQLSPGWATYRDGLDHVQMEELKESIEYFELALEIDPELSSAASSLGNVLLRLDQLERAQQFYQRALAIDPFDDQAITGVGIVMARQGRPEEAVEFTVAQADRCPRNLVFEYNTACVYGRAVENLNSQPRSEQRDTRIQGYSAKAVQHLRESIRMGFDDFALLETDPDLHALRDKPGFGKWEEELE